MSEEEVKVTVKKRRGRPPKKKIINVSEKRIVKKEKKSTEKITKNMEKKSSKKHKGSLIHHLVVMIITASIVGGGIYFWQASTSEDGMNKVRTDARTARIELENKIKRVTDKLKGIEYENTELKTVNEKLKSKTSLLDGAKKDFSDNLINFSLEYPAIFGNLSFEVTEAETGNLFRGKFKETENLIFGGAAIFQIGSTTKINTVLNTKGYVFEDDKYYFRSEDEDATEAYIFRPFETMKIGDMEIALITKHSFADVKTTEVVEEKEKVEDEEVENTDESKTSENEEVVKEGKKADNIFPDLEGEKAVAAIINLSGETFKGVTILNKNTDELSFEDFKEILKSVEIK